jgi:hypothetical protein
VSGSCGWFPMRHDEIVAWVEAHRSELPKTLAELATFPIPFRKVIVNTASVEQRIAFWHEHFLTFVGPTSSLTVAQQALVTDAIDWLPELFDGTPITGHARARELEGRMRPLFTREQAGQIFGIVGPPEPPEGLPLPADAYPTPIR